VLRVLGNLLGLPGFGFETSEEVKAEALGDLATLAERLAVMATATTQATASATIAAHAATTTGALERIADVPIYATDAIVRRASALQMTADARPPTIGVPAELAAEHGIVEGTRVRVSSSAGSVTLPAHVDASLAANVIRVPAGHASTAALGPMFGALELSVEAVAVESVEVATR